MAAGFKAFKNSVRELLLDPAWEDRLAELTQMPLKKALGPLFSFLCDRDPLVTWRAVTAFGVVVNALAGQNMEAARVTMRRLMWSLNEESGAIGWGAPEALGECMAQNADLAREYHRMLISYAQEPDQCDGNYLEHAPLRRGVYWGLARLAETRPALVKSAMPAFVAGVQDDDPQIRGLSALALGLIGDAGAVGELRLLLDDNREIELYRHQKLRNATVAGLADQALARLASPL
jgi:hypothetical protein